MAREVGAGILARGGNAVDAAVATAFAMTVVEPFMSTIAGSGTMLVHLARKGETVALNFNGVAPLASHETLYKVVSGFSDGLFSWPRTENAANEYGHRAVAVPGSVAGLCLALQRYGTMELRGCHGAGHRAGARRLRDGLVPGPQPRQVRRGTGGLSRDREELSARQPLHLSAGRHAAGRSLDRTPTWRAAWS